MLAAEGAPAIGAGDHVMVHFIDEAPHEALHSRAEGEVLCLRRAQPGPTLAAWACRRLPTLSA
jgi:hypothetical protein